MIAKALSEEIKYKISDNMLRGAADTYFPVSATILVASIFLILSLSLSLILYVSPLMP
jgi:hypothetical protein